LDPADVSLPDLQCAKLFAQQTRKRNIAAWYVLEERKIGLIADVHLLQSLYDAPNDTMFFRNSNMRPLTQSEVLQFVREFMHFIVQFRQCGYILAYVSSGASAPAKSITEGALVVQECYPISRL
jgi:hypothetical protein